MNGTNIKTQIDGEEITIRPIQSTDRSIEADFVHNLSSESRHFRFLGGVSDLSPQLLSNLCDIDYEHTMAFVATIQKDGEEIEIAVSRYAQDAKKDSREMAITVADEWQNKGLGTLLVKHLIDYAKNHGVKMLYSIDLVSNIHMRQLAKDLGMKAQCDAEDMHQVIYSMSL